MKTYAVRNYALFAVAWLSSSMSSGCKPIEPSAEKTGGTEGVVDASVEPEMRERGRAGASSVEPTPREAIAGRQGKASSSGPAASAMTPRASRAPMSEPSAGSDAAPMNDQNDSTTATDRSGTAAASCVATPACGGSILGSWRLINLCLFPPEPFLEDCPAASVVFDFHDVEGLMTFDDEGMYSLQADAIGTLRMQVPRSCISDGDCARLEDGKRTCTATTEQCICTSPTALGTEGKTQRGGYQTQGDMLILENDRDGGYCVEGTQMSFGDAMPMAMPTSMMGVDETRESIVQFKFERD